MLPAYARLRRREQFNLTIRGGRRASQGAVVVHFAPFLPAITGANVTSQAWSTSPARSTRAGLIVSKSVGNAVVRNRVARRLRHLLRPRLDQLPPGSQLVVRALPQAATRSYDALSRDLDVALSRLLLSANSA